MPVRLIHYWKMIFFIHHKTWASFLVILITSDTEFNLTIQVWHAVGRDRRPLRKQYLEVILPPFAAILRRWRPLLAGIHELTSPDGQNPLIADDRALAADALPIEVC